MTSWLCHWKIRFSRGRWNLMVEYQTPILNGVTSQTWVTKGSLGEVLRCIYLFFFLKFSGSIHTHWSSDDFNNSQSRDHANPTLFDHPWQTFHVVPQDSKCPKRGQGFLHVPSQYRSNGIQSRTLRCSGYVFSVSIFHKKASTHVLVQDWQPRAALT